MSVLWLLLAVAHASPRLTDPVHPVAQAVSLSVDPAVDTVSGTASLDLVVEQRVGHFHLHGEELTVTGAVLRKGGRTLPVTITPVDGGRLRVDLGNMVPRGRYTLVIDYTGPVHTQPYGLYRFTENAQNYLVTQLEADDARTVWPSFDEPGFKVPFTLTVRAPEGLAVVSNGAVAQTTVADGVQTVRFSPTPPIPSYAGALAVGPYASVEVPGLGVPSRVYVPDGHLDAASSTVAELPGVVQALEAWFGEPYPYAKLDLIAASDFAFGAMENPGAIVMAERLMVPEERETARDRQWLVEVLAHEVAHQWFGNLVTMAWWDDFWLNESFANWMGGRILHHLHPAFRRDLDEVRATQNMVGRDGMATVRPLRTEVDPAAVFETANFAVYPKGEALLTMVEAWVGPKAFQAGIRDYLAAHRWGNATADDLFTALSKAGGQDVAPVLRSFLDAPGAPLLTFVVGDALTVQQARYARLGAGELPHQPWHVPLHLRVGFKDGTTRLVDAVVREPAADLGLTDVAWVMPMAEGVGYFAWDLQDEPWSALLDATPMLDAREQVAVLGNAELLVDAGRRDAAWALGLVSTLDWATDPEIVGSALGLADYAWVAEDLRDEALEEAAHSWLRGTLRPWLDAIGPTSQAGESPAAVGLRRRLMQGLAAAGDEGVRATARTMGEAYLGDPTSIDPELVAWAMGVWVEDAPPTVQEDLLSRAMAATDPGLRARWLGWAGAVRGPEATGRALELALASGTTFGDMFALLGGVADAHEDDEAFVPNWVMEHYDEVAAKLPPQFRMRLAGLGGGCDMALFERTRDFFQVPSRMVPGVERVLAETEAGVTACVARREAHGASVRAFLAE